MRKISSFILMVAMAAQFVFADGAYSLIEMSESEFETEFGDMDRVMQIIDSYIKLKDEESGYKLFDGNCTITGYHELVIPGRGIIVMIEFSLYVLPRDYLLELYYDPIKNFLEHKIHCFSEPSKEPRFYPFERKWDLPSTGRCDM